MSPDIQLDSTNISSENINVDVHNNASASEVQDKRIRAKDIGTDYNFKRILFWPNIIGFLILHSFGLWGFWMIITGQPQWKTLLWTSIITYMATEGVTIGAHRLFTHKSFTATAPLRALLVTLQTIAGQNCMYIWVRDHRQHHRYSDTDADPHNSKRGFFFSHIGWLMSKKHPMVLKMGKTIDMSDLENDPFVMFQKKYYKTLYFLLALFIPVAVPVYFWGENLVVSLMVAYMFRYTFSLNGTWLVNSAAHLYGTRPYDKNLQPVESWFVSLLSSGEGWHNYHHAYPWDYKAAELGMHFNASAMYIRWFEKIGLASDLKVVSTDLVKNRVLRTGDGTHDELGNDEAKAAVTAPLILHPLNPMYNTSQKAPIVTLDEIGLPLSQEEDPQSQPVKEMSSPIPRRRFLGSVAQT